MIAEFRFTLPDEDETYDIMRTSVDAYSSIKDFNEWLRRVIKYEDRPKEEMEIYAEIQGKLHAHFLENEVEWWL